MNIPVTNLHESIRSSQPCFCSKEKYGIAQTRDRQTDRYRNLLLKFFPSNSTSIFHCSYQQVNFQGENRIVIEHKIAQALLRGIYYCWNPCLHQYILPSNSLSLALLPQLHATVTLRTLKGQPRRSQDTSAWCSFCKVVSKQIITLGNSEVKEKRGCGCNL